jgi:exosortase
MVAALPIRSVHGISTGAGKRAARGSGAVSGVERSGLRARVPLAIGGLLLLVLWSYWPTLVDLHAFWAENDDYSVGQLVPLVAVYLVYQKRAELRHLPVRSNAWGWLVLALSQALRFGGLYFASASAERLSLIVLCGGLVLLTVGWQVFRSLQWVQLFLLLMLPLPARLHNRIAVPLQDWATGLGRFGLELLGFFVAREGNVLRLEDKSTVLVAEACSGLRMLMAFVFTAAFLCFLIRRPVWQKVVLMLSSIPVALLVNGLRVLLTSLVMYYSGAGESETSFHDLAGLAMMPVAIALLLAELRFLQMLSGADAPVGRRRASARVA